MQFAILAAISVVSRLMMTVHICLILSNAINYTLKINQIEIDQVSYERHEIHIMHKMRNIGLMKKLNMKFIHSNVQMQDG